MPLYRGLFGKGPPPPAEDPTRRIARSGGVQSPDAQSPSTTDSAPATGIHDGAAEPAGPAGGATRLIVRSGSNPAIKPSAGFTPRPAAKSAPAPIAATTRDPMANPVVGWLAVVGGPGVGEILPLSYGVNDIGRGADVRVQLNFGDETITGGDQTVTIYAAIIYTARTRRFYLQSVAAETWLNERLVSGSVELTGGETLRLGQTRLRFVPLCGPDFDWRDGG